MTWNRISIAKTVKALLPLPIMASLYGCAYSRVAMYLDASVVGKTQKQVETKLMFAKAAVSTWGHEQLYIYDDAALMFQNGKVSHFCANDCARFEISIDSISEGKPSPKSVIFIASNGDAKSLEYKRYLKVIKKVFEQQGFIITTEAPLAEIIVNVDFGISLPKTTAHNYSIPVYGQVSSGGFSSINSSTTYHSGYGSTGNASTTGSIYTMPQYGVVGISDRILVEISYIRWLNVSGRTTMKGKGESPGEELWKFSVTSSGTTGDLKVIFPILALAMNRYQFKNLEKKVNWWILESDPDLKVFKY